VDLDSLEIGSRQLFLGSRIVPLGYYERVRLTVNKGSIRRVDGSYADVSIEPVSVELALPSSILLGQDDSRILLLNWDVLASLVSDNRLRPALSIGPSVRQLPVDLVYVSCPDIDTIFVVRSDKNWVVDSFGLKGRPSYLYLDSDSSAQRLTVLASGEAAIKVVDLSSQRIIDSFRIPLTNTPTFMTLSPDGAWAYVIDERNNYLSRLDLLTGSLAARVHTNNYRPQYMTYLVNKNLLAVSSALSQTVSFLDPLSLAEVGSTRTSSSPDGLMVTDNRLWIAESGANTVSVYDLATNQIQTRLSVGFMPRRLLDNGSQIYVSNYDEGSISVILPGQSSVGRVIPGLGRPLEMAYSQTYQRLYVSDEQTLGLAVIDTANNQFTGYINLGARPVGLATTQ
jgi:DNA-binding beta-propeller fold protein YncE